MGEIATKFSGRVDYFLVYITEAHPTDGWWSELGGTGHESFGTTAYAKSTEQRVASAKKFVTTLGLNAPVLVVDVRHWNPFAQQAGGLLETELIYSLTPILSLKLILSLHIEQRITTCSSIKHSAMVL